jgi:hypothetical protein
MSGLELFAVGLLLLICLCWAWTPSDEDLF